AALARRVERHVGLDIFKRLRVGALRRHARPLAVEGRHGAGILADGPSDAALNEVVKAGVAPGALVVAPGGVEDPALAVRPYPCPRLPAVFVFPILHDRSLLLVVLLMHIGLVPALEAAIALHDGMVRHRDRAAEGARRVALELRPDEFDVLRRVAKARR